MELEYLRFFHIASAFLLVSGIALAVYGGQRATRTKDVDQFEMHLNTAKTGGIIATVSTVIVSVLGVLTAWRLHLPLTSTGWLIASYITVFAAVALPNMIEARNGIKAMNLMPQAREKGEVLPEQIHLIDGPIPRLAGLVNLGLLIFILVLMVFKPF